MTTPIGYWCPECGGLKRMPTPFPWLGGNAWLHNGPCTARPIPVYEPLAVPEVTTWGESGGDEVVCISQSRTGHAATTHVSQCQSRCTTSST